ncbi:hypothetical protein ACFX13_000170 [Malus domestica]
MNSVSFLDKLPRSLGRNSKLEWVDVSTNNFNDSVPSDIYANGQLLKLMLFSNNFFDDLSISLSKLGPKGTNKMISHTCNGY